jgi:hypothetical protein
MAINTGSMMILMKGVNVGSVIKGMHVMPLGIGMAGT